MKEQIKARILPKFIQGLILTLITVPFAIGVIIKVILGMTYLLQKVINPNATMHEIPLSNKFLMVFCNNSPDLNFQKLLTWGNLLAFSIIIAFVIGIAWMRKAYDDVFKLQEAKRKAENEDLINDYRKK